MRNLLVLVFLAFASLIFAQDYVMYETHYLTPKPGHEMALMEEIAEHNKLYHAEAPYFNWVFSIVNGPRTGDLLFAMGPMTFTQNDDRPGGMKHNLDWASVMSHAKDMGGAEYWKMDEDLTYSPESEDDTELNLSRVRYFEVADNDLFRKVQKQIKETIESTGSKRSRTMYRKQFQHRDGRDWASVSWFENWAELDDDSMPGFEETFKKVHGADAWDQFTEDFDKAIVGREDEWRWLLRDLMPGSDD